MSEESTKYFYERIEEQRVEIQVLKEIVKRLVTAWTEHEYPYREDGTESHLLTWAKKSIE